MQVWRLGAYEVVRQLGEGGMAQVYLTRDVRLGREVAVKVLDITLANRPGFKERFLREAQVAAALDHPHIVPLYDFGETDGQLYLVMPFISGGSLQDLLRKTPLPVGDVVTYGAQMADALAYAHERGVVHRDVKPANMLLHADGRLMLSDFGLAKILTPESRARSPRNQPDAGTPEYMAPEQIEGQTDERSDIYALGIVLYLLLTGRLPFTGSSSNAVMGGHLYRLPEEPRRLNPAVTPAMQTVIMQALAKHPEDRFQRASDLAAALLSALVAGDAEPLPFILSNPTPPPFDITAPFPAPPRLTPPGFSPARTPAGSSGVHPFAPPPAADNFELPQLGERVVSDRPSPMGAPSSLSPDFVVPAIPAVPPASPASSYGASPYSASPTPITHRLTGVAHPGDPLSPVFPIGTVDPSGAVGMPGLDLSAQGSGSGPGPASRGMSANGPASRGLSSGRRQSLVRPPAAPVSPVMSAPASPDQIGPAFVFPAAPPRRSAPPAAAPRRSGSPPPVPAVQPSGGHGLRAAIIWLVVLLALAALVAGLVIHLVQVHSGAAAIPVGSSGVHVAALDLLAALGPLGAL